MPVRQLIRHATTLLVVTALVAACAQQPRQPAAGGALQQHTDALAQSIFPHAQRSQPQRVGVGSLVPIDSLRQQGQGRERVMVQQIQEGLISAATQRGANVIEFRTSTQLRLEDDQELMLSRQLADLRGRQRLDYFLTGTYSEVNGGLMVNLRLISVSDNSVERAATHFFPWASIEDSAALSEVRHGQLYRHSTQALSPPAYQGNAQRQHTRHRRP